MLSLYHQVGHNSNWNIDSFEQDNCGDGLILSPVHQPCLRVESLSSQTKGRAFFDPQFYLPNSTKQKLQTYEFFPEVVSGGFRTTDFMAHAFESARLCIDFQISNGFDRIIIPARYFEDMEPTYIEKQEAYTLTPFLEILGSMEIDVPVYFTLPLTSNMIKSEEYRTDLLNWLTGYPEIDGLYVFSYEKRATKQVQDDEYLYQYLAFLHELKEAEFELIVGYSNTESILYSLLGDVSLTMGSFENTRMFSIDKFLVSDDERRGPRARIYLPGLLNWIQFGQAKTIMQDMPDLWRRIYSPTNYADETLAAPVDPTFNQPKLYKHYFQNFSSQIESLKPLTIEQRYNEIRDSIRTAMGNYEAIQSNAFDFERHGSMEHLQPWLDAINRYYRNFIR